jgi:hypothetical protein
MPPIYLVGSRESVYDKAVFTAAIVYMTTAQNATLTLAAEFEGAWFRCSLEEREKIGVVRVYQMMNGLAPERRNHMP